MEAAPRQPRVRPESIVARNFSEDLDSLFGLHSGTTIGNLSETVQAKKRTVSTQERELAELESRLRETEERLARAAGSSRQTSAGAEETLDNHRREQQSSSQPTSDRSASTAYVPAAPRPTNSRMESFNPHIPGAMPRTPTPGFEGREYVTVDRTR